MDMMKKSNMLFLVLAVFAVLAGCHKDGIPDKAEPKVTELTVVPAQTGAVFSWKVEMPGKYQTCIEVSGKADMADAQSVEATENDGKYEASVGNLLPDTAYYYRVVVWNSFLSHKDGQGSFSTLAADPEIPDVFTISLVADPAEGGTMTGGGDYLADSVCTVTATANEGYCFVNWTENDEQVSTDSAYTFTVTETATYIAHFQKKTYTVSVAADPEAGGTVTGGGTFEHGQSCTVKATANEGYTFTQWQDGNTSNPRTITVTGDATYTATFARNVYTISVSADPSNGGTVSGGGQYEYGDTCTLRATAATGYTFSQWQDGNNENPRTITVYGNATYTAYFTIQHQAPTGAINGLFTINDNGDQVYFSQGNLQYQASTNTWRFATNQYDYIGNDNSNISQTYSGWIDLFGWGTSGYNHGATCYQPWSTSTNNGQYNPYNSTITNLYDGNGQADWGYNAISNGGNTENSGWRTLTQGEWDYVFNSRSTSSGIRYAKAQVAGVNGVILLPDDWSTSYYSLKSTNQSGASFTSNVIGSLAWTNSLQSHGAVFLPAAGYRGGTSLYNVGSYGYYWSASCYNSNIAYDVYFDDGDLYTDNWYYRYSGQSVRLVCPAE